MTISGLEHLTPAWTHLTYMDVERGEGIYLYDHDGNRYTDFTSGYGVANTGHSHPRVVKAIQEQAAKLIHGQINIVIPRSTVALGKVLAQIMPDPIDTFFFASTGAEAVEGAVKLSRQYTKKTNVIVFRGSFHGRTAQAMAMTTSGTKIRAGYQPLPAGIFVTPYPYPFRLGMTEDQATDYAIEQLKMLLAEQTAPSETAAIVIEPTLGEGGYVPAPIRFLQELRQLCTEHGIMMVVDEIQSGFGRTGKFFDFMHADIVPDIVIMAKGLGSGMPISGVASSAEIWSAAGYGSHGGTYSGGALPTSAALATVQVMIEEDLPGNSARQGEYLIERLQEMQSHYPIIGDVRGRGLMVATEFVDEQHTPSAKVAKAVRDYCISHNLLLLTTGVYDSTIRWIPPLIVTREQIDEALKIFEDGLRQVTLEIRGQAVAGE